MRPIVLYLGLFTICVGLGLAWQALADARPLVRLFASSPRDLADYVPKHRDLLVEATAATALEALCGLAIAACLAWGLAVLVSLDARIAQWILPPLIASQVIPLITFAPMLILMFGIGLKSKVVMAAIMSFFPVFINLVVALRDTPAGIVDMMMLYKPSWWFRVTRVHFPLSLPSAMAGLRVAATLAVIGAIVAEFTGADVGLGKNLFLSVRRLDPELMMASVFLSAMLGGSLYAVVVGAERAIGRWYLS